jgi:GNAT superfamily N-acetyltransferase
VAPESDRATLVTRPATEADRGDIIALLRSSLGWQSGEEYELLFTWKHLDNPFGPSPAWVATDGNRIVGFRTMLRWRFLVDGRPVRAVRAVDTATHPDFQGRGIFSRLTRQALTELEAQGVACVFNTPNSQSRPGYLKMGWQVVRRVPLAVRPRSPLSLGRMLRARMPADRWSMETSVGRPAGEAFTDEAGLKRLLGSQPPSSGLQTDRSVAFLRWRYAGLVRLHYRVLMRRSIEDGYAVFRLRRRGGAVEAVIADEVAPDGDRKALHAMLRSLPSLTGCDYVIRASGGGPRGGFFPIPRQGPTVTCRSLGTFEMPRPSSWHLTIGDVELL